MLRLWIVGLWTAGCLIGTQAAEWLAVIDYADEWTQVRGLTESLDRMGVRYDDRTEAAQNGELILEGNRVLFLSSMVTNDPRIHQALDDNAEKIAAFVQSGGIVIEPTQADQNEANVDWLPEPLRVVRSDPDRPQFTIVEPDHPLFTAPNRMTDDDFAGWGHQGWPTVWEVIAVQEGFTVLAESAGSMAVGEAEYEAGRFLMMCVAPDKYAVAGNDNRTKEQAFRFFENIVNYVQGAALSVRPDAETLPVLWGALRRFD
ncbi:MAG: hypothetical protein KatS3mg115_2017 [Candidatus Poribacteria bacterium]|nr:MAG: hypothetical protein KatS3mg115_2017 [Candidatus Poribacteria bacterium]